MSGLTQEEMEDIVERLRADIARMEREGQRDRLDAAAREKKLEADNAAIISALARRLESDEVIERAANSIREGERSPATPPVARRTVVVGTSLFPEIMEAEGSPPPPAPVEERRKESTGVEAALMAMRDSVMSLTTRLDEAERRAAHNPPGMGFEERGGPFTTTITQTLRSRAAKPLKLNYGGEGDPHLFLDSFKSHTNAKGYSDAACCNMFQETLSGEALSWFYELPAGSIDCFKRLADRFVNRFILRTDGQSTAQLFKIKQGHAEGLKAFVNRWQGATARVRSFDKKVAEEAFIQALLPGKFLYAVRIENPRGYDELMEMAVRHAQADHDTYGGQSEGKRKESGRSESRGQMIQEVRTWKGDQGGQVFTPSKRFKDGGRSQAKQIGGPQGKNRGNNQNSGFKETVITARASYTNLNATPEVVWNENKGDLPGPAARRFPPSRLTREDTGKYCGYHREATHAINNCDELRRAIESQLKAGKLRQYVLGPPQAKEEPIYGTINTIRGGARIDRRSNKAKKQCPGSRDGREIFAFGSSSAQSVNSRWGSVTFEEEEEQGTGQPHEDPFLVTVQLDHYLCKKILIDTGASVNVLFRNAWRALKRGSSKLTQDNEPLISFSGDVVQPLGSDYIPMILGGQEGNTLRMSVDFIVVDCDSAYNGILGRPALWKAKAFIAGHMLMMKLPSPTGIVTIRGDQVAARGCYAIDRDNGRRRAEVLSSVSTSKLISDVYEDPRINAVAEGAESERPGSVEETELVCISDDFAARTARIGAKLPPLVREELIRFLKANSKAFAWSYADVPGIPSDVVTHRLGIRKGVPPVRQKRRSFDLAKYDVIKREVQRLLDIKFIQEAKYPQWLANVVMVPKKAMGQWRMCVDYTNLNRACPKDSFPLPRIDQLVDSTSGFEMLSFMDAYAGYNQIMMDPADEEHTAFTTDKGVYYYKRMPFGLKNAGATYQRLMNMMFAKQLGVTMEVYVDDMLVKSHAAAGHVSDLQEIFDIMLAFGMRLNPEKCTFGVVKGKFLGHVISRQGIEANPEKVQAIMDMVAPKSRNDVQSLTGKVAALARFISRLTDKCAPFFKLLKSQRCKMVNWGPEQEEAFRNIKEYLASVPKLSKPIPGEMLYLYLAASGTAVSSALIRKDDAIELPVYYVGKGYTLAESRYPELEKLALALIVTARKLRHYFQAHSITLFTNCPLRQVLLKPETSGRLAKWAIELGEFDIHYMPRVAIKGQAAADFISELTPVEKVTECAGDELEAVREVQQFWKLFVDGSVTKGKSGAGIILVSPDGFEYEYALEFNFTASNNAAEYEALIGGLQLALEIGVTKVEVFSDSQLVVNQVGGTFEVKEPYLNSYRALAKALLCGFGSATVAQIPRKENSRADALARLATGTRLKGNKKVKIEILDQPSINKTISEIFAVTTGPKEPTWMDPIIEFLKEGVRPENRRQARKLQSRCARYTLVDGKLYRRGYSMPSLKCVSVEEGEKILRDIHEGVCGNHSGARSLSFKALRTGYFWPNMGSMADQVSTRCHKCHQHANKIHSPSIALSILMSPWPFAQWGLDLIGKLPTAPGQYKFIIVAVDYYTKWVEAEPLRRITTECVMSFLMKNIYCRFGIPETIITDNGTQFNNPKLIEFAKGMGTKMVFASVAHPKTNGQVEAVNKIVKKLLKKKVDDAKGLWAEMLPETLWAIRTTATESTGETPFSLAFGTEAVIPIEVTIPTGRVEGFDEQTNIEGLQLNLDLIEEKRDRADLHNQVYKQRVARHYDCKVRPRALGLGDWVMKRVMTQPMTLDPTWEGPYEIVDEVGPATFFLRDRDGTVSGHPWNAEHLRFYPV